MKYVLFLTALLGFSSGQQANAAEARRFRWFPKVLKSLPSFVTSTFDKAVHRKASPIPIVVPLDHRASGPTLLPAAGELVEKSEQFVGPAKVDGTWIQTIFHPDGRVLYSAGSVFDELPEDEWLGRIKEMKAGQSSAIQMAKEVMPGYKKAARTSEPQIRLRKRKDGSFEAYWRMEYVSESQDQVLFLSVGERGELLETGEVPVAAADGRAMVYPQGPKWSPITEVPLHQLNGDGTLTSRFFRITSALDLDVRSPNLLFFFPETDRRFDLSQVYFTMEQSLKWMQDSLGVELKAPLEVRLHIGDKGVSNAAFYHENIIYLGTGDGVIYKDLTRDPSVVIHESIHAVIDSYAGLPSEGEGGAFNEGFADFFTALISKNPRMGDNSYLKAPYRRTLENDFKAYRDFSEGTYRNGSVIAGTLWDMRAGLSDERLAKLAFRTLIRLGGGARFEDFVPAVQHAAEGFLDANEQQFVMQKLTARGWTLP